MTETTAQGGLWCELDIPLEISAMAESGPLSTAEELANQQIMKVVLGLDEVAHDMPDDAGELGQELQRLDFKVNVLLELVARLVSHNVPLPEPRRITLGPESLQWSAPQASARVGQALRLKLYLDQRFPSPLCLAGEVVALEPLADACQVTLALAPMSEYSRELFEKYLFRCHRRHVARLKSQN